MHDDHSVMKERIEETARHLVYELERFLNTLGTIATILQLMGLLGAVIGIMRIFGAINDAGVGDPQQIADGISVALITTVSGLIVAIPSLFSYRYLRGRIDNLVINMDAEALKLIEVMRGEQRRQVEVVKGDVA
jgi:biopolymer transport protein ExbB